MSAQLLTIIIPMFNEEGNVEPLFARLIPVAEQIRIRFGMGTEVVVNDNCSTDRTLDELRSYADRHDPELFTLRIFRFSSNIGFQKSILVGYRKAAGDAVAQIDADLQDPPELLINFIEKWREGYHVIYGVRRRREEGFLISSARKFFYQLIDRLSEDALPRNAGDFRLLDRSVVDVICALQDQDPYLRGSIARLGLKQTGIVYDRTSRQHGLSKFGLGQLIKLALDGLTNHTTLPLRLASYLALAVVSLAVGLIGFYVFSWFYAGVPMPVGFMTQTLLQLGTLAALSLLFAIQGFYIQRIYNQLKERPLAIIEHAIIPPQQAGSATPTHAPIEVLWVGQPARSKAY
jgi:dolichol-phosphate mannosyltransferase